MKILIRRGLYIRNASIKRSVNLTYALNYVFDKLYSKHILALISV